MMRSAASGRIQAQGKFGNQSDHAISNVCFHSGLLLACLGATAWRRFAYSLGRRNNNDDNCAIKVSLVSQEA